MDIHKAKNLLINYLKSNNKHSIKENKLEIVETDVCDAIIVNIKFFDTYNKQFLHNYLTY